MHACITITTQHIPQFQGHKHTTISCKQRVDVVDNKQRNRSSEENVLKMICTERYDLTFLCVYCVYALRHRHQYKNEERHSGCEQNEKQLHRNSTVVVET